MYTYHMHNSYVYIFRLIKIGVSEHFELGVCVSVNYNLDVNYNARNHIGLTYCSLACTTSTTEKVIIFLQFCALSSVQKFKMINTKLFNSIKWIPMPVNPFQIWNGIAFIISSHCGVSFLCRFIQHKEPEHCSLFTRHGLGVGDTTHGVVLQFVRDNIPH